MFDEALPTLTDFIRSELMAAREAGDEYDVEVAAGRITKLVDDAIGVAAGEIARQFSVGLGSRR